jgi:hypothetical protein
MRDYCIAVATPLQRRCKVGYATLGEWTTVAWVTGDRAYLLAVQGDRNAAEQLVRDS